MTKVNKQGETSKTNE